MAHVKTKPGFFTGWLFLVCSVWLILPAVAVTGAWAVDNKIGVIDTSRILLQTQYSQQIKAEFMAGIEEQRKILDKKREDLERQQQRLIKAKESGRQSARIEKEERELEKGIRELKWMKDDFDKELVERDKEALEKMKERIRLVLEQFVATTDYCIILEKQRVIVYCGSADVTDEIIKLVDSYKEK